MQIDPNLAEAYTNLGIAMQARRRGAVRTRAHTRTRQGHLTPGEGDGVLRVWWSIWDPVRHRHDMGSSAT